MRLIHGDAIHACELSLRRIEAEHLARFDLVNPPMQLDGVAGQSLGHRRMRLEILQLRKDVLLDADRYQFLALESSVILLHHSPGACGMAQPTAHGRHVCRHRLVHQPLHGTAMRMTTHDDVPDAQPRHRQLNRGRFAARRRSVRRNEVAGVTQNEQLAGLRLRDEIRIDTRIGAGNEQRVGRLTARETFEQLALRGEERRLKVMKAIVEEQRDFFEKGEMYLHPLTLQNVASKIGMHESTVSRVTSGKYCQTPRGVFELKYFFSSGLTSDGGEDVSAKSAKAMIAKLIEQEDKKDPLSDQRIAEILKEQRLDIARRTVAKYREQLNMPNARYRKRH